MGKRIAGLDITDDTIHAVVVDSSIHGDRIQDVAKVSVSDLPEESDRDQAQADNSTLERLLVELKKKIDLTGVSCYAAYPSSRVFLRNLSTPFSDKKKIRQIISFELEPALPVPVENIVTDFHQVTGLKDKADEMWVVSASTDRTDLDPFLETLKKYELEPRLLSMGSMAAAVCTGMFSDKGDKYLFVNIGHTTCTLYLIASGQICYARVFTYAEKNITEKIAGEIRRTIISFQELYQSDYTPEFVEISGEKSTLPDAVELARIAGYPVRDADILSYTGLVIEEDVKPLWSPVQYNTALAVAWSGISGTELIKFSESGFSWKKFIKENRKGFQGPLILSTILVALLIGNMITSAISAGQNVDALEVKMKDLYIETFPSVNNPSPPYYQKMESKFKVYQKETEFAAKGSSNVRVIDILNEISLAIPDSLDIEFNRFVYGSDDLKISGFADAYSSIDEMKKSLEKVKIFRKVILSSSVRDSKTDKFRFKLKVEI